MSLVARHWFGLVAPGLMATMWAAPVAAQDDATRPRASLIVIRELRSQSAPFDDSISLLELMRTRLPVVVQAGRFDTDAGIAFVCVHARRSSVRSTDDGNGAGRSLPRCPMIPVYVNGVRIEHAPSYLESTRVLDLESVELVRASEANFRHGFTSSGVDVLAVWTRGRGPHAHRL